MPPTSGRTDRLRRGRRQRSHWPNKRGANTTIHLAVDAHGMSVRVIVTAGSVADITGAPDLTSDIEADAAIADKGYDSQEFVDALEAAGIGAVIPPRKNREVQRVYDKHLYTRRHVSTTPSSS